MTETAKWFHCSVKPISRSAGRSAVAAAAYRSGEALHEELTDQTHDYTRRQGVETTFIVAPDHAPEWAKDWGKLWNAAEAAGNRKNSQTAREVELALPAAVSAQEREKIVRKIAGHLVERYGVAVACALHEPSRHGDQRNYHAHILMTTKRMGEKGLTEKTRELDDRKTGGKEVTHIRYFTAAVINESLASNGSNERVDPRSNKARGIEQMPTRHLGVEAAAMERRKKKSRIGDLNRDIEGSNQQVTALQKELTAVNDHITRYQSDPLRYQHEQMAASLKRAFKKHKVKKLAGRIAISTAEETLKKRLVQAPIIEPPQNPLDPTPGGSYAARIRREQQDNEITR